jgi:hypothetical protein
MTKKRKKAPEYSEGAAQQPQLKRCLHCKGKDGKHKIIYETPDLALEAIQYLENEKHIQLSLYRCPCGNGYHLTKDSDGIDIREEKDRILRANGIPLESSIHSSVSWEYENQENREIAAEASIAPGKKRVKKEEPIKKILPDKNKTGTLKGKITEIIDNVDIGKRFNVNINNQIAAGLLKDLLSDAISQITIHAETDNITIQNSYTVFIAKKLLQQNKAAKGSMVALKLRYKMVNNIKIWHSDELRALKAPDPTYRPGTGPRIRPGSPPEP